MSRTHTYRVWDTEKHQMRPVSSLHFGEDGSGRTITMWLPEEQRLLVMGENAELMESTGLTDTKGKKIYEDDLCFHPESPYKVYAVYWNEDRWGLRYFPREDTDRWEDYDNGDFYRGDDINNWHEWKVIGNRYANPEFLKKEARVIMSVERREE